MKLNMRSSQENRARRDKRGQKMISFQNLIQIRHRDERRLHSGTTSVQHLTTYQVVPKSASTGNSCLAGARQQRADSPPQ